MKFSKASVFCQLIFLLCFPLTVLAQSVDRLDFYIETSQGDPVRNALVEPEHFGIGSLGAVYTDDLGLAQFVGPYPESDMGIDVSKNEESTSDFRSISYSLGFFDGPLRVQAFTVIFDPPYRLDSYSISVVAGTQPAPGVEVEITGNSISETCTTNSQGVCALTHFPENFPEGDYSVTAFGSRPNSPLPGGTYFDTSISPFISVNNSSYQNGGFEKIDLIDLTQNMVSQPSNDRSVIVKVYEPLDTDPSSPDVDKPVGGVNLRTRSYNDPSIGTFATTDSDGTGILELPADASGTFTLEAYSQLTDSLFQEFVLPPGTEDFVVTLVLPTVDSSAIISIISSTTGQPVNSETDSDGNSTTWIDCLSTDPTSPSFFSAPVPPGENEAIVPLVGGKTYICSTSITESVAVQEALVSVDPNGRAKATLFVTPTTSLVRLIFEDSKSQEPISNGTEFDIACRTYPFSGEAFDGAFFNHSLFASTSKGTAVLELVDGIQYSCFARLIGSGGELLSTLQIGDYRSPGEFTVGPEVNGESVSGKTLLVPVSRVDSEIQVCLRNTNGAPLTGSASIFSPSESPDGVLTISDTNGSTFSDIFQEGKIDSDGCTNLPAFTGRDYFVQANPDVQPAGTIIPGQLLVSGLKEGKIKKVTVKLKRANFTLSAIVDPASGLNLSEVDYGFCHVEDSTGAGATTELLEDGAFTLELRVNKKKPQPFFISCGLFFDGSSSLNGTAYSNSFIFTPPKKSGEGSVQVLFDSPQVNISKTLFKVRNDSETNFTLPDGSTASFPVHAISSNGQGSFVFETPKTAAGISSQFLFLSRYDFSIRNNGVSQSIPGTPPYFCFYLDPGRLKSLGASASSVKIARLNDFGQLVVSDTKIRTQVGSEGTIRQFACAYLDHFSLWNVMVDVGSELKATTATKLRIKPPRRGKGSKTANKWKVKYQAPEQADSLSRFIFDYNFNRKQCKKGKFKKHSLITGTDSVFIRSKRGTLCGQVRTPGGGASNLASKSVR